MDNELSTGEMAAWTDTFELDPKCTARGTNLCWRFASGDGCESCYLHGMREEHERSAACEQWEKTVRLLPRDIDRLSHSDTCWFCAGDEKEPADGYAVLDMANPEPYHEKGIFFGYGKKVRTPVGSLVSLHIAIGKKCRKAFRTVTAIQIVWPIGMIILALVLLGIPAIATPMANLFVLLPAIFLGLMGYAGYTIGRTLSMTYMQKHSDEVHFDVGSIPLVAAMLRRDWFFFQTDHGMPRMSFTKKRQSAELLPPCDQKDAVDTAE